MMKKAVFLDRDGVVNELVFHPEQGVIDSPMIPFEVTLVYGIDGLIKRVKELDFITIVCSNQPGVGLGKVTSKNFKKITDEIISQLKLKNVAIDKFYYCMHHPFAKISRYKLECNCRKPKIGLFLKAVAEHNIDLSSSWMIGDGADDIKAGKAAGCKTILLANINSAENLRIIEKQLKSIKPDFMVKKLSQAVRIIEENS